MRGGQGLADRHHNPNRRGGRFSKPVAWPVSESTAHLPCRWAVPGGSKFGRQSRRVLSHRTIRATRDRVGLPRCWELPGWRGTSSEASSSTRWKPRRDVARRYCGERPPFAKYRAVREPHERSASHVVGTGPLHGWARFSVGRIILQRPKFRLPLFRSRLVGFCSKLNTALDYPAISSSSIAGHRH